MVREHFKKQLWEGFMTEEKKTQIRKRILIAEALLALLMVMSLMRSAVVRVSSSALTTRLNILSPS